MHASEGFKMNKTLAGFLMISLCLLITSCALNAKLAVDNDSSHKAQVKCTQPRPEVCTREYMPVCATVKGNGTKTYSNGCTACSDLRVVSYVPGECGDKKY